MLSGNQHVGFSSAQESDSDGGAPDDDFFDNRYKKQKATAAAAAAVQKAMAKARKAKASRMSSSSSPSLMASDHYRTTSSSSSSPFEDDDQSMHSAHGSTSLSQSTMPSPFPVSSQVVCSPCVIKAKNVKIAKKEQRVKVPDNELIEGSMWTSKQLNGIANNDSIHNILKIAYIKEVNTLYGGAVGDTHMIVSSGKGKNGLQINCVSDRRMKRTNCKCLMGLVAHNRVNDAMQIRYINTTHVSSCPVLNSSDGNPLRKQSTYFLSGSCHPQGSWIHMSWFTYCKTFIVDNFQ